MEGPLSELDGEDDMQAINAELGMLDLGNLKVQSPLDDVPSSQIPDTPHFHGKEGQERLEDVDPMLLPQPELSSSASSARDSSLGNRTPASILPTPAEILDKRTTQTASYRGSKAPPSLRSSVMVAVDEVGFETNSGVASLNEPAKRRLWNRVVSAATGGKGAPGIPIKKNLRERGQASTTRAAPSK